jgi:hypothetical protein
MQNGTKKSQFGLTGDRQSTSFSAKGSENRRKIKVKALPTFPSVYPVD